MRRPAARSPAGDLLAGHVARARGTCRSTRSSPRSSPASWSAIRTGSKIGVPKWKRRDQREPAAPRRPCRSASSPSAGRDGARRRRCREHRDVRQEAPGEAGDADDDGEHDRREGDVRAPARRAGCPPSRRAQAPGGGRERRRRGRQRRARRACAGSTIFGAVGPTGLPKIQLMPTRISETPMTRMIVPVTTGGKKRSIRLITGASRIATMPAPMIAPKIIRAPSGPGLATAIDDHRADRGEGHAHHHRQLDAEPAG